MNLTYWEVCVGKNQWFMPFVGFDVRYRKLESGAIEENYLDKEAQRQNEFKPV
jgi:hypothetical protein